MKQMKIIGILIRDRVKEAGRTQEVLSKHAALINSRLGFHEVSDEVCSRVGVIVLQLSGETHQWKSLESDLKNIGGIEVQDMAFNY